MPCYCIVYIGIPFSLWKGAYIRNNIALMACTALNGYHSRVEYQWSRDGTIMVDEIFPIIYVESSGVYTCTITSADDSISTSSVFRVEPGMEC